MRRGRLRPAAAHWTLLQILAFTVPPVCPAAPFQRNQAGWLSSAELANLRRVVGMSFASGSGDPAVESACLHDVVRRTDEAFAAQTRGEHFRAALRDPAIGVPPDTVRPAVQRVRGQVAAALGGLQTQCTGFSEAETAEAARLAAEVLGKAFLAGHSAQDWRAPRSAMWNAVTSLYIFGAGAIAAVAGVAAYWRLRRRPRQLCSPLTKGDLVKLQMLGEGSFGAVWRARWRRRRGKSPDVALKMSCIGQSAEVDMNEINAATAELMAMAQLGVHPYIVSAEDFFIHTDVTAGLTYACIVMEYCSGGSLQGVLHRNPDGLPLSECVRYTSQVLEALQFAHNRKPNPIVHRDIKPENILLDASGDTRLSDFGLSITLREIAKDDEADHPGVVGTRAFMAPEWFGTPEESAAAARSPSVDIWSLGCVLFECATGQEVPTVHCEDPSAAARSTMGIGQQVSAGDRSLLDALVPGLQRRLAGPQEGRSPRSPWSGHSDAERVLECFAAMVRIAPAERPSAEEALAILRGGRRDPAQHQQLRQRNQAAARRRQSNSGGDGAAGGAAAAAGDRPHRSGGAASGGRLTPPPRRTPGRSPQRKGGR